MLLPSLDYYARAGFAGDADAMIALHEAGVPGTFVLSQLQLLNGKAPESKEGLAQRLIGDYKVPAQGAA